ncbi:hypothetical protein [Pseudolactococcus yaeyamensis]
MAFRYMSRHFRQLLSNNLPMFITMIFLNGLMSMIFLFPKIFQQLTTLQETEMKREPFSQGIKSIGMLHFFNGVLLIVCLILILFALFFLISHTAISVKQFVGLEKETLQTRYQLVIDEKYVFKEFFLSRFFILILGAPINYVISILLQQMIVTKVMAFYEMDHLKLIEVWFIPLLTAGVFVLYLDYLMRKYAKKLYQNTVISKEF